MRRDRRFFAGLVAVAAVVSYLVWTGISDTMLFFVTPSELLARFEANPESMERGVRVGAKLVPASYERGSDELLHRFVVEDPDDPSVRLEVEFRHALPDTFTDDPAMEVEVVMQGVYRATDNVFEATEVLTRCGSRYEAMPEADVAAALGGLIE
jgi:cytochrome c-type biogenesis protein CcmE